MAMRPPDSRFTGMTRVCFPRLSAGEAMTLNRLVRRPHKTHMEMASNSATVGRACATLSQKLGERSNQLLVARRLLPAGAKGARCDNLR